MLQPAYQEWLRRLALGDERAVERVMCGTWDDITPLDDKTAALVRLSALIAAKSEGPYLVAGIDGCYAAGFEQTEVMQMVRSITLLVRIEEAQSDILTASATGP